MLDAPISMFSTNCLMDEFLADQNRKEKDRFNFIFVVSK